MLLDRFAAGIECAASNSFPMPRRKRATPGRVVPGEL
jgi:hypothetical protein